MNIIMNPIVLFSIILISTLLTIHYILFTILLFNLYKKLKYNPYFSLIPLFKYYRYFSFIKLPFIFVFVPVINFLTIFFSLYRLSIKLKNTTILSVLSMFIPTLLIDKINASKFADYNNATLDDSFSNMIDVYRTTAEIDNLEKRLESDDETVFEDANINETIVDNDYVSPLDQKLNSIEESAIKDDVYEDLLMMESNNENKKEATVSDNVENNIIDNTELQDLFSNTDIRTEGIDTISDKIEEATNKNIVDNAEYKEYKEEEKDVSTIAFGGIQQEEKIELSKVKDKEENGICPYCKNKVNPNDTSCPTCNRQLK